MKTLPCTPRSKPNRVLDTEVTATVPMVVLRWALSKGQSNPLRTYLHVKYIQDSTGRGMFDMDLDGICKDLQVTRQTICNHVRRLEATGFMDRDGQGGWFCRSWEIVAQIASKSLYEGQEYKLPPAKGKVKHCIVPVRYIGSRTGFKAMLSAHLIGQALRSQERMRRKASSKVPEKTGEPCRGGALSAGNVGGMVMGTKMQGSKIRRLAIDHGWLSMQYQFTPTSYTRWHLDQVRSGLVELDGVERMRLFGDKVWMEQCPWLDELSRELRVVRRRGKAVA